MTQNAAKALAIKGVGAARSAAPFVLLVNRFVAFCANYCSNPDILANCYCSTSLAIGFLADLTNSGIERNGPFAQHTVQKQLDQSRVATELTKNAANRQAKRGVGAEARHPAAPHCLVSEIFLLHSALIVSFLIRLILSARNAVGAHNQKKRIGLG